MRAHRLVDARRVDDAVQRRQRRERGAHARGVPHVERRDVGAAEVRGQVAEPLLVARAQRERGSLRVKLVRERAPEALARAHDPVGLAAPRHRAAGLAGGVIAAVSSATLRPSLRISERLMIVPSSSR